MEQITHEALKRCLADDPKQSQGIGADNMTFLIATFKSIGLQSKESESKDSLVDQLGEMHLSDQKQDNSDERDYK